MPNFTFDQETHTGLMDGVYWPSVTQLLQEEKLIDYSMVPEEILENKRILGTRVDAGIQLLNNNELDEEHFNESFPECIPYLEAYRKFRTMEHFDFGDRIGRLHSVKWKFHGQPDEHGVKIMRRGAENYLIDWKCTFKMFESTGPQMSGYEILLLERLKIRVKQRFGLQLKPTGFYELTPFKDKAGDTLDFHACLRLHWQRRLKYKTKKGGEQNGI